MTRLLRTANLATLFSCVLLLALFSPRAPAQETEQTTQQATQGETNPLSLIPVARKFDEFGQLGGCDYGARADNFAIQLLNDQKAEGYVICYGPGGEGSGSCQSRADALKDYLVNMRGLDPERIKSIYGGRYKELNTGFMEIWIVPPDAAPPTPTVYEKEEKTFTGKYAEFYVVDSMTTGYEEGVGGPSQGNLTLAGLADVLRRQPDSRVYIVASNTREAVPGAWRRAAKEYSDNLINGYHIEGERLTTIRAGYFVKREDTYSDARVQLWILPKDAPPPVAELKEAEAQPEKAVLLDSVGSHWVEPHEEARIVFDRFVEVLRDNKHLNACLLIRLPSATQESEAPDEKQGVGAETENGQAEAEPVKQIIEEPKVDLAALVEKWKADLLRDYGIGGDRLFVIVATADDWHNEGLETWIIPAGASLPDPYAREETFEESEMPEVGEENPKEF
jgi:hypothetical protein